MSESTPRTKIGKLATRIAAATRDVPAAIAPTVAPEEEESYTLEQVQDMPWVANYVDVDPGTNPKYAHGSGKGQGVAWREQFGGGNLKDKPRAGITKSNGQKRSKVRARMERKSRKANRRKS